MTGRGVVKRRAQIWIASQGRFEHVAVEVLEPGPRDHPVPFGLGLVALDHGAEVATDLAQIVQRREQCQGLPQRSIQRCPSHHRFGDGTDVEHVIDRGMGRRPYTRRALAGPT